MKHVLIILVCFAIAIPTSVCSSINKNEFVIVQYRKQTNEFILKNFHPKKEIAVQSYYAYEIENIAVANYGICIENREASKQCYVLCSKYLEKQDSYWFTWQRRLCGSYNKYLFKRIRNPIAEKIKLLYRTADDPLNNAEKQNTKNTI